MARVLEIDDCYCEDCSTVVKIGRDLYCPILGCAVRRVDRCQVGVEKSMYDELIKQELEDQLEEAIHQSNYQQDCIAELNEQIEKLDDENQTLKVALSLEEMIRS